MREESEDAAKLNLLKITKSDKSNEQVWEHFIAGSIDWVSDLIVNCKEEAWLNELGRYKLLVLYLKSRDNVEQVLEGGWELNMMSDSPQIISQGFLSKSTLALIL